MSDTPRPGQMRTGGGGPLTVGDLQDAVHGSDRDIQIDFGSTMDGIPLIFYRFKWRGEKLLQIELNEEREF
ncbi:MAG: hypothetical protein ACLQL2_06885 [Methylovirgula sp.]